MQTYRNRKHLEAKTVKIRREPPHITVKKPRVQKKEIILKICQREMLTYSKGKPIRITWISQQKH